VLSDTGNISSRTYITAHTVPEAKSLYGNQSGEYCIIVSYTVNYKAAVISRMKSSLAALSGHRNCTAEGQLTQPHLASIDFLLHKDASSQATKIQKVPQKMDGCND